MNSRLLWKAVNPYKCFFTCENTTIENKRKLFNDNLSFTEIFNAHYVNIVEISSVFPPSVTENLNNLLRDSNTVKNINEQYKNHPSINIKNQTNLMQTLVIFHM